MSLTLSDEIALLAVAVERAGTDPEALILVRLEFESLWAKFKRDTEELYQAYRVDAAEEFELQMAEDIGEAPRLAVVKGERA